MYRSLQVTVSFPMVAYGKWEGIEGLSPFWPKLAGPRENCPAAQASCFSWASYVQLDWNVRISLPAERENVRKVRQGAYAESVNEILSAAIKRILTSMRYSPSLGIW